MVRYFYTLMPPVVVGAVVLLSLPWLGLIALFVLAVAALAALTALAWAIVAAPLAAGRTVGRRWHERGVAHHSSIAPSLTEQRRHA
jgi:hypothetical protein